MTHQVPLTIIAEIKLVKMDDLKQLLEIISEDVESNKIIPFVKFN